MIKMKVSYIAWQKNIEFTEMFYRAILKTLKQQED